MAEEFDFEKLGKDFDAMKIAYEEMAKGLVPLFLSFRKEGLSPEEAAAMTTQMVSRWVPTQPPEED